MKKLAHGCEWLKGEDGISRCLHCGKVKSSSLKLTESLEWTQSGRAVIQDAHGDYHTFRIEGGSLVFDSGITPDLLPWPR